MKYDLMVLLLLLFVFLLEILEQVAPPPWSTLHKFLCMNFSTFNALLCFFYFCNNLLPIKAQFRAAVVGH